MSTLLKTCVALCTNTNRLTKKVIYIIVIIEFYILKKEIEMTIRKQREIDKRNQKMLAKSFLSLLCKEKLFREAKAITQMSLKKYNSQYRFNLFYDDHDDWIHGSSYRVTIFFKASKEIEVRIRELRSGQVDNQKIKYPNNVMNSVEADNMSRKIIKQYEKVFKKGFPWLKERFTPLKIGKNDIAFYKGYIKDLKNWFFADNSIIREMEYINRDKDKKLAKVRFKTDENAMVITESPKHNKICFYATTRKINKNYLNLGNVLIDEKNKLLEESDELSISEREKRFKKIIDMYKNLESYDLYHFKNYKINEIITFSDTFNNEKKAEKENYNLFKNSEYFSLVKNLAFDFTKKQKFNSVKNNYIDNY